MKKYFLHAPYSCLVIEGAAEQFLDAGQILELTSATNLHIYPTQKSHSRPAFSIDIGKSRPQFYVVDSASGHIFLTDNFHVQNITICQIAQENISIEIGESALTFAAKNFKRILSLPTSFDKFSTGMIGDFAYCLLSSATEERLFLVEKDEGGVKMLSGEQIKILGGKIIVNKNVDDIARHTIEEDYLVSGKEFTLAERNIGYQLSRPVVVTCPQTLPYAFLEAIKMHDFSLAQTYLDLPLRRDTDEQKLKNFFGEIVNFYPLDEQNYLILTQKECKKEQFCIKNDKISEINEIE